MAGEVYIRFVGFTLDMTKRTSAGTRLSLRIKSEANQPTAALDVVSAAALAAWI
jgi:mevalonate pyrophosphate decarboxylase